MPIVPGGRVGPYLILAPLGSGGMGEVYRATDTRLDRAVAVKVLSPRLADDADALGRFEREAKAIAALSHPNILGIHELGTYDGVTIAATELLDGETLRVRLADGALPLRKSLEYAQQMAQGLAAAHGRGIVHRDLKPENLFITREGRLKILDFGLAKLNPATAIDSASLLTTPAETNPGTVLGTAGYMSPEQVRGEIVDHRSDIFAFGAVLYEMLTGRRAFSGASAVETMAAVLKEDPPDFSVAGGVLPSSLERVVRRCLEKRPDERFHSAHDLGLAIGAIGEGSAPHAPQQVGPVPSAAARSIGWIERAAWLAVAIAVAAGAAFWGRRPSSSSPSEAPSAAATPVVSRWTISAPPATGFYPEYGLLALSPDGRQLAFIARGADGISKLWVRPFDAVTARLLPGTDGAIGPFWSPDGRYVAYFTNEGHLMKIAIAGGEPQPLAKVGEPGGGTWNRDGVILFNSHFEGPLNRIRTDGGEVSGETQLDATQKESNHLWPFFLPDGQHYLFQIFGDNTGLYVGRLGSKDKTLLVSGKGNLNELTGPVYAPSGHVLYVRGGSLMALPFDAARAQATGEPFQVANPAEQVNAGGPSYATTADNVLVYSSGATEQPTQLVWVDRSGKEMGVVGTHGRFDQRWPLSISPDDRRVALTQQAGTNLNVWTVDLLRGAFSKVTFDQFATSAVWSPDGRRLAYAVARDTPPNLYVKELDGTTEDRRVFTSTTQMYPFAWAPDGKSLFYQVVGAATGWDIWRVGADGASPTPVLRSRFNERDGRLSRDGRWLAYMSDESSRNEIYVMPVSGSGRPIPISTAGGSYPVWHRGNRELFYRDAAGMLCAVTIQEKDGQLEAGLPRPLFKLPGNTFDVSADGQRILVIRTAGDPVSPPLTVVTNWTAALGQTR